MDLPLEWDAVVTAIMLDLGYKVDNYWTRQWGLVNPDVKEQDSGNRSQSNTQGKNQKRKPNPVRKRSR